MKLPNLEHRAIVTDLITQLPKEGAKRQDTCKGWTQAVKAVMRELGQRHLNLSESDWQFCGTFITDEKKVSREWLFDVAWYIKTTSTEGIVLALESEWNNNADEVEADFCKLLATKAPLKIFLFSTEKKRTSLVDRLQEVLNRWKQHSVGDAIYAIDFSMRHHTTWHCEVGGNLGSAPPRLGKLSELCGPDAA